MHHKAACHPEPEADVESVNRDGELQVPAHVASARMVREVEDAGQWVVVPPVFQYLDSFPKPFSRLSFAEVDQAIDNL